MTTQPQNGQVWTLLAGNGLAADVNASQTGNGNRIQGWAPNGSAAQGWVFWAKPNNTFLLETRLTHNAHAAGQAMVMDYDYSHFTTHLFQEHGQANQLWHLEDGGDGRVLLRSARPDEGPAYLTADAQGAALGVWRRDPANQGQVWRLAPAGSTGGGQGGGTQPQPQPQPAPAGVHGEMLAMVNEERRRAGVPAMRLDDRLSSAAQRHANDLASHDLTQHNGTDGSDFSRRISDAGYAGNTARAENVTPANSVPEAMRMWMDSPGHRSNILNGAYRNLGVGYAPRQRGNWGRFVQTFGS
ncbi:CAP domain-containing protein [Streptomyces sp. NBC_00572]|uniref:CAP domain-containing protein n=1 Tax=Streptomyces sp. NBC_00572 TaxID=2903664 RepID=UPI0022544C2B|nr:CAP domain-containing protein [Streptomyces sp. NBC_00572]MCX4983340.1 CAP domain-containing protein [Streptomyces sp. NBC_00572]